MSIKTFYGKSIVKVVTDTVVNQREEIKLPEVKEEEEIEEVKEEIEEPKDKKNGKRGI